MTIPVLFGHPDSGHACKVALALSMADIDHEVRWVDIWAPHEARDREFREASPLAEVPLLKIGDVSYSQSGAILLEIASRWKVLGGESQEGLRRGRELIMWEANRIGMCLPQLKASRRVHGKGFSPEVITWLQERFAVDSQNFAVLLGNEQFFHGSQPGVGDCAIWGYVQWLEEAGVLPNIVMQRWIESMMAVPGVKPSYELIRMA